MLKGKTKSGFKFEVSDTALNNYELLEVISEVDSNPVLIPKVVNMLLGNEQKAALIEHLRSEDGVVPVDAMSAELIEIFQSGKIKNS